MIVVDLKRKYIYIIDNLLKSRVKLSQVKVMKKTFKSLDKRNVSYGSAYIIKSDHPDYLVGRLLTIIEAIGLPEKQEKSLKDLIRFEIYNSLNLGTWVPSGLHNIIVDYYTWYQKESPRLYENDSKECASIKRGHEPVDHSMNGSFELSYKED